MSDYARCRQCGQMVYSTAKICPYCHIDTPNPNLLALQDFAQKQPATFVGLVVGFGATFVTVCAGAALWPAVLVGLVVTGIVRTFIKKQIDGNTGSTEANHPASVAPKPHRSGTQSDDSFKPQSVVSQNQSVKPKQQQKRKQISPAQQKIRGELNRLRKQRREIRSRLDSIGFGEAAKQWYASEMERIPTPLRTPITILFVVISPIAVLMVIPAIVLAIVAINGIWQYQSKLNADVNEPIRYQLSTLDKQIAKLESQID